MKSETESGLQSAVEWILTCRDFCGNEGEALREWECDNYELNPAERFFVFQSVEAQWNAWRKAAGVKGAK